MGAQRFMSYRSQKRTNGTQGLYSLGSRSDISALGSCHGGAKASGGEGKESDVSERGSDGAVECENESGRDEAKETGRHDRAEESGGDGRSEAEEWTPCRRPERR